MIDTPSVRSQGRSLAYWGSLLLIGILISGLPSPVTAQRFLPDDPLWSDPDRMDMPFPKPQPADEVGGGPIEFARRLLRPPIATPNPAVNANTVQGVPNSSWYTNRHYRFPMSEASLRRGSNTTPGPAMSSPWQVERIQNEALLKIVVRDATGRRFRLLFDATDYPEMATGAAMVSSRLLHALGYNVPHYWLRRIDRARLVPHPDSTVTPAGIDSMLARTSRRPNGTYRVLVSRIPGVERRIGPFAFHGTRVDDANDVFPHEDRRELRGLRLVSAWLQHSMIRHRHTLDVGVREDDRRFVRHYLTDLHLTLGSGGAAPKPRWSGHKHLLELDQVLQRVATIGLSGGDWSETTVPNWPAVGHFESAEFHPTQWRPEWPNPAFQRATPADAFWAAKKIRHVSRTDIAAIVETADYSSVVTENYIIDTLLRRRNAIGQAYLHWGGGLARFTVQDGRLQFQDLRARYNNAPDSLQRTVTWHVFENRKNELGRQLTQFTTSRETLSIPPSYASFLRVQFQTEDHGDTRVFLRRTISPTFLPSMDMPYEVVGVERRGPSSTDR